MKQEPDNQSNPPVYNTVNSFILIKGGALRFIEFVEKIFDAHENKKARTPDKDGTLIHAEIQLGNSMGDLLNKNAKDRLCSMVDD